MRGSSCAAAVGFSALGFFVWLRSSFVGTCKFFSQHQIMFRVYILIVYLGFNCLDFQEYLMYRLNCGFILFSCAGFRL